VLKAKRLKSAERELARIYATLPTLHCQGICQASCGPIAGAVSRLEAERLFQAEPLELPTVPMYGAVPHCCHLGADGRCKVHEVRPLICRGFGLVADKFMICPFGCVPDRYLSNDEFRALWARLKEVDRRLYEEV
jgi:Fe-S-cluster containining protein